MFCFNFTLTEVKWRSFRLAIFQVQTSLSAVFCYTPAASALMKQLCMNHSPVPCTCANFLTCREVQSVVLWVDRGCRSEDEMWTEAWVQSLQGYVALIVAQHHLAGGGPRAGTRCKTYRTHKNERFQALIWSWVLGKGQHRMICIHTYWGKYFLHKCLKMSRVRNLRQDMVRFLVVFLSFFRNYWQNT